MPGFARTCSSTYSLLREGVTIGVKITEVISTEKVNT